MKKQVRPTNIELLTTFYNLYTKLGRVPTESEFEFLTLLRLKIGSIDKILKILGILTPKDKEYLNIIKEFHKKHNKLPVVKDLGKAGFNIQKHFITWRNAIMLAGFDYERELKHKKEKVSSSRKSKELGKKEIIEFIQKFVKENQRLPRSKDILQKYPSAYQHGALQKLVSEANIDFEVVNKINKAKEKAEKAIEKNLAKFVKRFIKEYSVDPKQKDFPSEQQDHFRKSGGMRKALSKAKIDIKELVKEKLLKDIREIALEIGYLPQRDDLEEKKSNQLYYLFGSFTDLHEALRETFPDEVFEDKSRKQQKNPPKKKDKTKAKTTKFEDVPDEILLKQFKYKIDMLRSLPTREEFPRLVAIKARFGIKEALQKIGYEHYYIEKSRKASPEEVLNILKDKAKELGRLPKSSEVPRYHLVLEYFGSFKKGLQKAGLDNSDQMKEKYLDRIRVYKEKFGEAPRKKDMPNAKEIIKCFSLGWRKIIVESGLKVEDIRGPYLKSELLQIILDRKEELGHIPKTFEIKQYHNIKNAFGSYEAALTELGFSLSSSVSFEVDKTVNSTPDSKPVPEVVLPKLSTPPEELLDTIKSKSDDQNILPVREQFTSEELSLIEEHFKSFLFACFSVGFRLSKKQLLETLIEYATATRQLPRVKSFSTEFSVLVIKTFKGWDNAIEKANLEGYKTDEKYSDFNLFDIIAEKEKELDRSITLEDMGIIKHTILRRFGSLEEANKAKENSPEYSRFVEQRVQEVQRQALRKLFVEEIQKTARRLDRIPTEQDVAGSELFVDDFGTWEDALSAAGIKPQKESKPEKKVKASGKQRALDRKTSQDEKKKKILEELKEDIERWDGSVSFKEFRNRDKISYYFKTLEIALKLIDTSKEQIYLNLLKKKSQDLNRVPKLSDFGSGVKRMISKCFGGWDNAIVSAGMTPTIKEEKKKVSKAPKIPKPVNKNSTKEKIALEQEKQKAKPKQKPKKVASEQREKRPKKHTKESIISKIQEWVEENQKLPHHKNFPMNLRRKAIELFGNFDTALRASNLESVLSGEILYPSDLIEILQKKHKELGRKVTAKDLGYDLTALIFQQFTSINHMYKVAKIGE